MREPLQRGEIARLVGFALLLAFFLWLATAIGGCGDPEPEPRGLSVDIHCDSPVGENRCFVLVHGATSVEAFYNGRLAWWDRDISNPEDRQTYMDSPPRGVFRVEACNADHCTFTKAVLP